MREYETLPEDWKALPGNYGVTTRLHCCWCGATNALVLEGESHDEEPWIGAGKWHCDVCCRDGKWDGSQGELVGSTGFSTPGKVRVFST